MTGTHVTSLQQGEGDGIQQPPPPKVLNGGKTVSSFPIMALVLHLHLFHGEVTQKVCGVLF